MKGLREGSRRKILRLIDKKLISWWKEKEGFYYKEDHSPVDGLRFKNNAEVSQTIQTTDAEVVFC